MTPRGKYIFQFISLFFLTGLIIFFMACNQKTASVAENIEECNAFIAEQAQLYNAGKIRDHYGMIRRIDSFYAARKINSPRCMYIKFGTINTYYFEMGNFDTASMFADSALLVLENNHLQDKYMFDYISSLSNKGRALYATGHYTAAYSYYYKAGRLSRQMNDTCAFQAVSYGLAMIDYKQKKYREAAGNFKSAFRSASHCAAHYEYKMQEELDDIALCFEKLNMPDSAVYYYDSAIAFITINSKAFGSPLMTGKAIGVVQGNKGSVLMVMGKTDSAINLFRKSYATNIKPRFENRDAVLTHLKLADAYLHKNEIALAGTALSGIRRELDTIKHSVEAECTWSKLMYEYSEKNGNENEAFKYYRDYEILRDSIWALEKVQLQFDLERELKGNEQLSKIDLLLKQNQLNSLYLWVTFLFSLLAIIIIGLILADFNKSKRNVDALTKLNDLIKEQKQQLEIATVELKQSNTNKDRILQVVAHDLRNPITGIMALSDFIKAENDPHAAKEYADMIINAAKSSLALISELLEFSNNAKPGAAIIMENTDLNQLVKQVVDLLIFKAAEKNQTIELSLHSSPLFVYVNK